MMPLRAYVFIGLNIIRVLSIIALILVFASNIETLVHDVQAYDQFLSGKAAGGNAAVAGADNSTITDDMLDCDYIENSTIPNQPIGVFWAVINRLFIIVQTLVLILSEVGWPMKLFDRFFPILGSEFGLGPVGIIQILIGASILSHHVDDFTLVSAFFLFAIGCINILIGLIFRDGARAKRSLLSWKETSKKSVLPAPVQIAANLTGTNSIVSAAGTFMGGHSHSSSVASQPPMAGVNLSPAASFSSTSKAGLGFGRQGEKAAAAAGFLISKPIATLPRYTSKESIGNNHE